MSFTRTAILAAIAWSSVGCAYSLNRESRPAQAQAASTPSTATVAGTPSTAAAASTKASTEDDTDNPLTEVVARCMAVQRSPELPVACQVDVVGDTARMQLVMANRVAAAQYAESAIAQIARPFCELANQTSQPAGVVLALHEERLMRVADCATRQFSDWQPTDKETQQLLAATRACEALQASSYPVGCGIGEVDGVPSLLVSYTSGQISEPALSSIAREIAVPFCEAYTASGKVAVVYLIKDQSKAKGFNCASRAETAWTDIRRNKPKARSRAASGQPANGFRPSYTLLPGTTASR